ncbi:MAG: HEAT repeat domain-containing protein [Deltaproteobacteria bacterium]|nr:HEAT repeat domain-containing protein [Deltaproteobacteria bacterium]
MAEALDERPGSTPSGPGEKLAGALNLNEEADDETAERVAAVFQLLLRAIKNINLYRHATSRFPEYLGPAHAELTKFLEKEHAMPLKLGPFTLHFKKKLIYEDNDKENLTYKFYKDGMRFLLFREGIPVEELLDFVLLATEQYTDNALFQEDMITRLWKKNFEFIEYIVVESFAFGDLSPEEVAVEVDKILAYLRKQLSANSKDVTRFARLDVEDLELELNDVEQVRGGIISGRPAKPDDLEYVQAEIYSEEKRRVFAKMVLILFQILERDCTEEDFQTMSEAFSQVLDSLILQEDVRGTVAVLQRFDAMLASGKLNESTTGLVKQIRTSFIQRMSEPQRLEAVGQYMTLAKRIDESAVRAYFSVVPDERLDVLLEMLERIERPEARRILIEVLAELGKNKLELFATKLEHNSSVVVKNMLAIIDRINPPNKIDYYAKCMEHPNIMIRLEGLKVISKAEGERSLKYLQTALLDEDIQMRMAAYRAIVTKHVVHAVPILRGLMEDEAFLDRDRREQAAIAAALGETRTAAALDYFKNVFERKSSFFRRGRESELKIAAIKGLLAMHTVDAYNLLAAAVQDKKRNSKDVMEAAHAAAQRLAGELSGQIPRPESHDG